MSGDFGKERPAQHNRDPLTPFHCQRCFVYPSRGYMSAILSNMGVRTALHRSILTPSPKGLGRHGCHPRPPTGVFRPLRRSVSQVLCLETALRPSPVTPQRPPPCPGPRGRHLAPGFANTTSSSAIPRPTRELRRSSNELRIAFWFQMLEQKLRMRLEALEVRF